MRTSFGPQDLFKDSSFRDEKSWQFDDQFQISKTTSSSAKITVANLNFEVDKFDGTSNFSMWQCEVLDILCLQELDIALEEKPKEMNDIDWAKINRQACSTIRSCLAKDLKHCVLREDSAKNVWKTLEDKYRTPSLMNRFNLWKKLLQFQYQPGISMDDHINTFNGLLVDLSCLDKTIEDEDKVILLLKSLPAEYEDLAAILLRGKDKAEYDVVSAALLNTKCGKGQKACKDMLTNCAKDECSFCHAKGHWKKNCPKLKDKIKGKTSF